MDHLDDISDRSAREDRELTTENNNTQILDSEENENVNQIYYD